MHQGKPLKVCNQLKVSKSQKIFSFLYYYMKTNAQITVNFILIFFCSNLFNSFIFEPKFQRFIYGIFHSILTTDFQFVNTSFLLYCGANTLLKFIYLAKNATKFKTKRNIFKSLQYFRNSFFEFWLINAVKGTSPTI